MIYSPFCRSAELTAEASCLISISNLNARAVYLAAVKGNQPTLNDKIQALSIEDNFKISIENKDSKKLEQEKLEQQGMG
ncbi:MAG: hypothetical protein EWV50_00140 [Microcystis aeruginosa Ma_MB_F_20061100_S20]|uniref:Uncharacterized protein n=1 Tax=Microcystis aeruginosa Ma_MB_F_20061100_S20D TaxID=2486253 RepID=A0A552EPE7_MICAE|nr:MAG: hypothetical protein EWV78_09295 [Microcystis aeruginosa Ma_MB_F_20061100_S20D]TRU43539.1 MAG: hypothetical protein EWV50_00140 [Microcystis aeruginosa Ma_MB_F_20061100_S20]